MKSAVLGITTLVLSFAGLLGCRDQGTLPPSPRSVSAISTGLDTLFTFPQDTANITISGGTPPYTVQSLSSSGGISYSVAGSTLHVLPNALGSDVARITDAASPAHSADLPVVVGSRVSFAVSIQPIFVSSYGCAGSVGGCHGGTMGLFLDNATESYNNLVNVPTQASTFPGLNRVTPRDLSRSVLYLRLSSNDPAVSMPRGRTAPFDPTYLSNVRTWILQGAHFN